MSTRSKWTPYGPRLLRRPTKINNTGKKAKNRDEEKTSREEEDRRMKDANIEEEEKT